MAINDLIAAAFIVAGCFFFFTSTVGLLRFPDFYSRMHATGKGDTLAVLLCLSGLAIHHGLTLDSFKLVLIAAFVFVANPTGTHAICRAAFRCGVKHWTREKNR
ncbi:MAG: monovalent cation/H(+) antiporter subunit G [Deltaproteobacteria bacterium]|nr:monovalent cation/H(+) antiporter subunit G [Candidatus Anaeroferrophillus wilburensis]MBN2889097.1 monovalent cation/H(+) antiporter subunit G [Deltaproteobacteria bacterium]